MVATSLQLIRNWLPFGRRQGSPAETRELHQWLDGLVDASAMAVAQSLREKLRGFLAEETNQHARLKLLEAFYGEAQRILPDLEAQIGRAPLPLPPEALAQALYADNLLKVLAAGYGSVLAAMEQQKLPAAKLQIGRIACARQIACLVRRQHLAYRAYTPASENSWLQLHQAYQSARRGGFADYEDEGGRIETLYVGALLLAYADPTKFSRSDFAALVDCVFYYAPLVRVADPGGLSSLNEIKTNALFRVRVTDTNAGRRFAPENGDNGAATANWWLDCSRLVGALEQALARQEQDRSVPSSEPVTPLLVLRTALNMWRGQPTRRFARQKFRPRADLYVGLDHVVEALGKASPQRRHDDVPGELAYALSEWTIVDESPDGFGLRYIKGETRQIQVGEAVVLRPRERQQWHVCLVRRVVNAGPARLEVGLQALSPQAVPFAIGAGLEAVFMPTMPGHRGVPGVIAPMDALTGGQRLGIPGAGGSEAWQAVRLLETGPHYQIWHVQPN